VQGDCLRLTLYPSITLALLDSNYVKVFGTRKGVRAPDDLYLSGRWLSPWRYANDADGELRDVVHELLALYGDCVGISISPGDEDLLFVVAFLTQNTNYHANVLRWARALFSASERLEEIAELAPRVGRSYQLQRLPAAVEDYLRLGRPRDRRELLRVRGVGPKVADLFLLFTGDTTAAPVDKHFARVAPRLGLAGRQPSAQHCRRHSCGECPLSSSCLGGLARSRLGRLAGWVQTLAYLADRGLIALPRVAEPRAGRPPETRAPGT
jgi:endonuclease III-like uncharacterized protein